MTADFGLMSVPLGHRHAAHMHRMNANISACARNTHLYLGCSMESIEGGTCTTAMGAPTSAMMSVLRGSGSPQRPQNTPSDTRRRRDSAPDPQKSNICGTQYGSLLSEGHGDYRRAYALATARLSVMRRWSLDALDMPLVKALINLPQLAKQQPPVLLSADDLSP